jgi:hypothetical protein
MRYNTPQKGIPTTDINVATSVVQLGEPMSFIGVTYRSINDSQTAKPIPSWVTTQKAGNLEHAAQPWGSSTTGWIASFPVANCSKLYAGWSVVLNLFQAGQSISASSRQLESSSYLGTCESQAQLLLFTLAERSLVNLVSFRDFLQLFSVVYFPV